MINRPQKQILKVLGSCVVVAVGAWAIASHLPSAPLTQPAETKNQIRPAPRPLHPAEISVRSGTSVTTPDGVFTIQAAQIAGNTVKVTVSAKAGDVYRFNKAEVGRRLVIPAPDATYYLDLIRIHGNTVYFAMSKHR